MINHDEWNYKIKTMKTTFLLARFDSHLNGESLNFRSGEWLYNPGLISALWGDSELLVWDDISKETARKYIQSEPDIPEEIKKKIIREMGFSDQMADDPRNGFLWADDNGLEQ
jgi:hypothetical protein